MTELAEGIQIADRKDMPLSSEELSPVYVETLKELYVDPSGYFGPEEFDKPSEMPRFMTGVKYLYQGRLPFDSDEAQEVALRMAGNSTSPRFFEEMLRHGMNDPDLELRHLLVGKSWEDRLRTRLVFGIANPEKETEVVKAKKEQLAQLANRSMFRRVVDRLSDKTS